MAAKRSGASAGGRPAAAKRPATKKAPAATRAAPKKAGTARKAPAKKAPPTKLAAKQVGPKKKGPPPRKAAPEKTAAPKTKTASKKNEATPKPEADRIVLTAAQLREGERLCKLADAAYRGRGVPEDFIRARALYQEAADLGSLDALQNLVFFARKGMDARWTKTLAPSEPVEVDLCMARTWACYAERFGADQSATIAAIDREIAAAEAAEKAAGRQRRTTPTGRDRDGQRAFVAERVAAAKLGRHAAAIDAALWPSLRLAPGGGDAPLGASRLGGLPDLPEDVPWPRRAKAPLSFIGQIDLAEASRVDPTGLLPKTGLVSFFYDLADTPWNDDDGEPSGIAVLHTPAGARLVRREKPADLVAPHEYAQVELAATPVALRTELTLPFVRTKEARALALTEKETERYWDQVLNRLAEVWPTGGEPFHRMLGHPEANQGDMTRRIAYQLAGKPDALDEAPDPEVEADAARFRLLLQVDTDEDLGSDWGSGRLFYWIREEDLAAGRFERTVFEFQG